MPLGANNPNLNMTDEEKAAKEAADKKEADDKAAADKAKADADARSLQDRKNRQLERKKITAARLIKEIKEESDEDITGLDDVNVDDDDTPLTRGDLKRMEREKASKTALQLAQEIADDTERNLVLDALENDIVPSGDPQKDMMKARALANSERSIQIAEEAKRKRDAQSRGSGGGAPSRFEDQFEPTAIELRAAQVVGKKTPKDIKDFILKVRAKEESKRK